MDNTSFFILTLTNVLTLSGLLWKLRGNPEPRAISPQPLLVRPDLDPLSREEHSKLCAKRDAEIAHIHQRVDLIGPQITTAIEKLDSTARERSNILHKRLDAIVSPLHILIGKVENHIQEHKK